MNVAKEEKQLEMTMLSPREACLMHQLFGGKLTEADAHILFDGLDLNTANQNYLLLLACLGYMKGWERFPAEMIPMLKGVHRYHQVHNAMGIPWLIRQLRKLVDAGIPVMLIKEEAMKKVHDFVPAVANILKDEDGERDFESQINLFKTLLALSESLPPKEKQEFMQSRVRVTLEYLISTLEGEPGLLKTSSALRKSGVLTDMASEEVSDADCPMDELLDPKRSC